MLATAPCYHKKLTANVTFEITKSEQLTPTKTIVHLEKERERERKREREGKF